ncbi:hypothetical protein [Actinomycetospora cinnamomea]|uniref:hypothetical protein n=1 Tax=Actinomycetospora cinnamomea TaxID=663609 RepID=UPI0010581C55|nr:hypothetical protein [Actinomycetospora cinnamomea]
MTSRDLDQELARRDALAVAALLAAGSPCTSESRVRIGTVLLRGWSADAEVRDVLRPVFAAAVPDQRALIALGDIDTWLRHGRIARGWWVQAAAGPDPELAALGAWRAARADLRGRRVDDALPLLEQAAAAGIAGAALALGRIIEEHGDDEPAAALFRRSGTPEGMLRLAEIRLRAEDPDGAQEELARFRPPPFVPGTLDLQAWGDGVCGEIAFRRGDLEVAEDRFWRARHAPGDRGRLAELRLAQIAIACGDASTAFSRASMLAAGTDAAATHARLLMDLHPDLMAEGARLLEQEE